MDMVAVDSRSIEALGYDAEHARLRVLFRDTGETYDYFLVKRRLFEDLLAADSIGRFFNDHIKGRHDFERLSRTS